MSNTNRKIDSFIDEKLRSSHVVKTSDNFSKLLMKRISAEHKTALEESKSDRLVKYIIGTFSTLIIGVTLVLGFVSGSTAGVESKTRGINFSPAVETSNNYLERFLSFIESVFVSVLNFFGLSANPKTLTIILLVAVIVSVFMLAERFLMRGKLRSSGAGIK